MADKLFNEPPDVLVTAHDIFGRSHQQPLRNFRFRVSVYGLLRRGDEILVNRHPLQSRYGLPGGGVELGEPLDVALIREFREETGLEIRPVRLLDVTEGFFTFKGEDAHGILLLYEVERVDGDVSASGNQWESVDAEGYSPLHHAAHSGSLDLARMLLASGANPRAPNDRLGTPLELALRKGHAAVADLLRKF